MPRSLLVVLAVVAALLVPHAARTVQAAQRCFPETGFCIDGRFREFWEQNGGLAVFGFPIGPEEQLVVDGNSVTSQRFERNRLELHPENKRPYDVLLGRLGADRLTQQGRDWFTFAKSSDTGKCRVFAETGHAVCGDILKSWRASGLQLDGKRSVSDAESLALFGMPLSGVVTETLSDGKEYQVQWFERARFELHPENPAPYNVLLGLLGNEINQPVTQHSTSASTTTFDQLTKYFIPNARIEETGLVQALVFQNEWIVWHEYAAQVAGSEFATRYTEPNSLRANPDMPQRITYIAKYCQPSGCRTNFLSDYFVSVQITESRNLSYAQAQHSENIRLRETSSTGVFTVNYQILQQYTVERCTIVHGQQIVSRPGMTTAYTRTIDMQCANRNFSYTITYYDVNNQTTTDVEKLVNTFMQFTLYGA